MSGLTKTTLPVFVATLWTTTVCPLVAAEPQERTTLKGHDKAVCSLAVSPDGKTLVSGSADGSVKLWDLVSGAEKSSLRDKYHGSVNSVAVSPDGKLLVAACDSHGSASVYDAIRRNFGQALKLVLCHS